jgi:hypothetical protein
VKITEKVSASSECFKKRHVNLGNRGGPLGQMGDPIEKVIELERFELLP